MYVNCFKIRVVKKSRARTVDLKDKKGDPLKNIPRRKFMHLSAAAVAGLVVVPSREAKSQDMPMLEESDPVAQSLKYTHDANAVDPASRANPAAEQNLSLIHI